MYRFLKISAIMRKTDMLNTGDTREMDMGKADTCTRRTHAM